MIDPRVASVPASGGCSSTRARPTSSSATSSGAGTPGGRWVSHEGYVKAQLLWSDGNPIEGFDLESCRPFQGDGLHGEITWASGSLADVSPGRDLAIRFVFSAADVFDCRLG